MEPIKLTLRKSDPDGDWDWWVIERAEHDGRMWMEPTGPNSASLMCSSRFSDADVEGTSDEMREIAKAIRARGRYRAKRCSVVIEGDEAHFCSPRNSQKDGVTTLACADELAKLIETVLAMQGGTPQVILCPKTEDIGTPEQKEQDAYGRWKRGSRADDPEREAAFKAGCICHFLEGDFHHGIGCPVQES